MKRIASVIAVGWVRVLPVAFAEPAPAPLPPGTTTVPVETPPSESDFFEASTHAAAERARGSFQETDGPNVDSKRLQGSSEGTDRMDVSFPGTDSGF